MSFRKEIKKKKKSNQILNLTKIFVTLLLNVNQNDKLISNTFLLI